MGAISVPTLALTTNKAVADIPLSAKGQVTWYCTELTGFCVRAGTTSKTFYLWRRVAGRGQPTFIRLGRVGQITLAEGPPGRPAADRRHGRRHQPGRTQTRRDRWRHDAAGSVGADQERDEEEGQVAGHVRRLRIQAQAISRTGSTSRWSRSRGRSAGNSTPGSARTTAPTWPTASCGCCA